MFTRLGQFVSRYWLFVIAAWVLVLIGLRLTAPNWDDITHDGDLAYLPANMPSVEGERLLAQAFPRDRAKSQIVIIAARDNERLDPSDLYLLYDLARRFKNFHAVAAIHRARQLTESDPQEQQRLAREAAQSAVAALDEALDFEDRMFSFWEELKREQPDVAWQPEEMPQLYHNRAQAHELLGQAEEAEQDRARSSDREVLRGVAADQLVPADAVDLPLLDIWTWRDPYFGDKLTSGDQSARLIVLQLSNEFMATDNIQVLEQVEKPIAEVRKQIGQVTPEGLQLGFSGSAAVGGDMLRASAESIEHTELFTVVLVILILSGIYRSPLLVFIPLVSITIALLVATSSVALLTQLDQVPGFSWWHLKVFTTTKIFVVVILFGAGTDYCLFLISRYREELRRHGDPRAAIAFALAGVGDALAASALTTIFGLGTMYFADFGKFRYSGPIIGLCLAVTLLVCVTFTPALLRALGRSVFWPGKVPQPGPASADDDLHAGSWFWDRLARMIIAYPGRILIGSVFLMLPLAGHGFVRFAPWMQPVGSEAVTYDFLSCLARNRPSKQGAELLESHFPVGESGPLTVLVHQSESDFDSESGAHQIRELADLLYVPGVKAVRCSVDPLGEYGPGERPGVVSGRALRLRFLRAHPRTKTIFLTQVEQFAGTVARFDLVLDHDPFSLEALEVLSRIDQRLRDLQVDPTAAWQHLQFAYAGTTAGIRDLRAVTQSDNARIEVLVVLAVLGVLLLILRRPLVCLYMIVSVLFSFYVTIGATDLFFHWAYGSDFGGLDWKVPLFLFVILVAIGQDYNVYLATRVFEEQARAGPIEGLRRAVVSTGGIITSCGVIMAGTFISMTSGTWGAIVPAGLPVLGGLLGDGGAQRGIVELGFALALGVALDTFVVRPILVPAFLCLMCRRQAAGSGGSAPAESSVVGKDAA